MSNLNSSGQNVPAIQGNSLITCSRFVLFLDIMGFKNRVSKQEHGKVLRDLQKFQSEIQKCLSNYKAINIQIAQFSDSIVLFSSNTYKASLLALSEVASSIMCIALRSNIPLKGALAKGKVTCDIPKQLFFGQALIDAYLLEENVKYYGILVHHTAEVDVKGCHDYYRDVNAFLKSGQIHHYELNWYDKREEMDKLLNRLRESVSDEPRKYVDNTLSIINESI